MLDTLAGVKIALNIGASLDDTLLERLMLTAESFIEQYTGRSFGGGSFTETHPAGGVYLFVANFPIATITSLKVDPARAFGSDTVRAASTYVAHSARGVIESLTGPFLPPRTAGRGDRDWPGCVQVVYTTATGSVPAAIKDAFSQLVGHWFRQVKTSSSVENELLTEKTDGSTTRAYPFGLAGGLKLPSATLQLLKTFRVPAV